MQAQENLLFTPTEAAVLTQLSVKAVNNAIDKETVRTVPSEGEGSATRLLDLPALMALILERRLADRFVPELRREVFAALSRAPRSTLSLEGGLLQIDLREPRRELTTALKQLRRARQLVTTDPRVMGGSPVFRGTRVPAHLIATMLNEGSTAEEVLEGYPSLAAEMVRLAPLYAAAYPQRGRPRQQPWSTLKPSFKTSRRLETIEAG
jgi:uncharacterized protein (DUF433 family)